MTDGYLTTHVLDTATGRPAAGLRITLFALNGSTRTELAQMAGTYELVFEAGSYLTRIGVPPEAPRFLDIIPIRFGVSDPAAHYHVPLLLSPFGYSTYRGS